GAEVVGIGAALWPLAPPCRRQERGRQLRQRQRIARMLATYGVQEQSEILDIACHRALDAAIAVEREMRRVCDTADARAQADDAAEAGGVAQRAAHVGA